MKEIILYDDYAYDFDEIKEMMIDEGIDLEPSDDAVWDYMYELQRWDIDDLNVMLDACDSYYDGYVAIADLGLWDGRRSAYGTNWSLRNIVEMCYEDYNKIWVDRYGRLRIRAVHHDGVNCFTIMGINMTGLSDYIYLRLCDCINDYDFFNDSDEKKYFRHIGKKVGEYYGV